jgi:subtilisin family serine protease
VAATLTITPTAEAVPWKSPQAGFTTGNYIVTLADLPAAAYAGTIPGLARTRPAEGENFAATSAATARYRTFLEDKHSRLLQRVGAAAAYHDYTVAFNGFAAHLTGRQAQALAKLPGVLAVQEDALRQPDTDLSPDFLGVTGRRGMWAKVGGRSVAGKGVIVGVIDTGIWPESRSFAGKRTIRRPHARPVHGIRARWTGRCETGERFVRRDCNRKLIGARYFVEGFGEENVDESDYISPRDGDGHGSHTASTAAGNRVRRVVVDGTRFGTVSGMAPAAKVAAYKVCWTGSVEREVADGCADSDSVAAIDQAVIDGVDVINYSIGAGSETSVIDPVEIAFMFAATAGVYNAASAGNSGPGESTLDHPSPWVSTTAAGTHRIAEKKLVLGNGRQFIGASTTRELPNLTPMVMAEDSGRAGVAPSEAELCGQGTLDPAKVSGKLVVCLRGVVDRIEKSFAVREAGGVGMVLINPSPNSLNGDLHAVPSVHLADTALAPVNAYVDGPSPVGKIVSLAKGESETQVPEVAEFSSRGPSTTTGGDILKPDLAAPGVDVLAAVAPQFHHGRRYDLISGTSMASPHNAGLAAVIRQAHPRWTPMEVKSALMTTARNHASTNARNGGVFAQGAGFVRPTSALDPGIVFHHGFPAWIGYLEEVTDQDLDGVFHGRFRRTGGSQLNQASIAIGRLAGTETVTRTLTNVSRRTETYRPHVTLPGVTVSFEPARVRVPAGRRARVEITFTRSSAAADEYTTGSLTWTGSRGHRARMPLAVRPVEVDAPEEVHGTGANGSAAIEVTAGFTGTLGTRVSGLLGTTPQADSVVAGPFDPDAPAASPATDRREVSVPAGTKVVRFHVQGLPGDDLDLWVYQVVDGEETLVDLSADADADEMVTFVEPDAGTYVAYVNGFATPDGGTYDWSQWVVGPPPAGNLTVTPASVPVTVGQQVVLTATWSGLDTTKRWLGFVGLTNGDREVGGTVVSVD